MRNVVVELLHPPHANSTDDRLDPPLGLLLIAQCLRENLECAEVRINDLSGLAPEQWCIGDADVYGVTVYAPTQDVSAMIAERCRWASPAAWLVAGGAHATAMPQSLQTLFDIVVKGEGELAMVDIVRTRAQGGLFPMGVIAGRQSPAFHMPAFDLVNLGSYSRTVGHLPSVPLVTSRGCPYRCAFCGLSLMHRTVPRVRFADISTVVGQIEAVVAQFGRRSVNFQDDMFTLDESRLFPLLDEIEKCRISFRCHGRVGHDREETYERLARAGCVQVAWGIESGSQTMLNRMAKQATVEQNAQVIGWAKKHGIGSRAFFVIGFPGETAETLEETKRFIEATMPDQFFVSNFIPYPGTAVWEDPATFGVTRISRDLRQYYQVGADGTGGVAIDSEWLTRDQFRQLEKEFREWIGETVPRRGALQEYEMHLAGTAKSTCGPERPSSSSTVTAVDCS